MLAMLQGVRRTYQVGFLLSLCGCMPAHLEKAGVEFTNGRGAVSLMIDPGDIRDGGREKPRPWGDRG